MTVRILFGTAVTWAALAAVATLLWLLLRRRRQLRQRLARVDQLRCTPAARHALQETYPHLSRQQQDEVMNGFRQFLRLCLLARGRMVAMPSQAVDALWHGWILDTRAYQRLCREVFGRTLHHTPAVAMPKSESQRESLNRAWRLACRDEGLDPKQARWLPVIFALDAKLQIPNGFRYVPDCRNAGSGVYCGNSLGCGGSGCSSDGSSSDASSSDGGCGGSGCGGGGGD